MGNNIKTSIGGQALIEGIMMRGPKKTALAVRNPQGEMVIECDDTPAGNSKVAKIPFIRGIVNLVSSLKLGYKYLMRSAEISGLEEAEAELAKEKELVILCGHYEGIDQRVIDKIIDEEISIGDYVLTGGEIPAMVLIDAVSRYIDGVLSKESIKEESFSNGLLEYPQYTRPEVFLNEKVPEVLITRTS